MERYPLAMHGPDGGFAVVRDEAEETKLREDGWIDGHQYWAKVRDGVIDHAKGIVHEAEAAVEHAVEKITAPVKKVAAKAAKKTAEAAEKVEGEIEGSK